MIGNWFVDGAAALVGKSGELLGVFPGTSDGSAATSADMEVAGKRALAFAANCLQPDTWDMVPARAQVVQQKLDPTGMFPPK